VEAVAETWELHEDEALRFWAIIFLMILGQWGGMLVFKLNLGVFLIL